MPNTDELSALYPGGADTPGDAGPAGLPLLLALSESGSPAPEVAPAGDILNDDAPPVHGTNGNKPHVDADGNCIHPFGKYTCGQSACMAVMDEVAASFKERGAHEAYLDTGANKVEDLDDHDEKIFIQQSTYLLMESEVDKKAGWTGSENLDEFREGLFRRILKGGRKEKGGEQGAAEH